jgi:uncharacterized membrane protein
MSWLQRHRIRSVVRTAVWLPPLVGMIGALLLHPWVRRLDLALGWKADVSVDGARALLSALASSMLTFIVFVFSILLVAVQLASAQLTPRIIALVYRGRVVKWSLTVFVFTFTFTLAVLGRIDEFVPRISGWIAVYGNVVCIGLFVYMIDHVGKSLRPVAILTRVGTLGQEVIRQVYPRPVSGGADTPTNVPLGAPGEPSRVVPSRDTGVVLAFDLDGLVALARSAGCVVELVPQVGDFVARGDALFRLHAGGGELSDGALQGSVAIGPERTLEQDPQFAFRIIVDIASKALSPAINDPTTGVLALDQIHRLLATVARQELDTGRVTDEKGDLRLAFRTPDWEDFLSLSVTEIRQFGRESIQVVRRMRALLESLARLVPPHRLALVQAELALLDRGVKEDFRDPEDQLRAIGSDSLGVGGSSRARGGARR